MMSSTYIYQILNKTTTKILISSYKTSIFAFTKMVLEQRNLEIKWVEEFCKLILLFSFNFGPFLTKNNPFEKKWNSMNIISMMVLHIPWIWYSSSMLSLKNFWLQERNYLWPFAPRRVQKNDNSFHAHVFKSTSIHS